MLRLLYFVIGGFAAGALGSLAVDAVRPAPPIASESPPSRFDDWETLRRRVRKLEVQQPRPRVIPAPHARRPPPSPTDDIDDTDDQAEYRSRHPDHVVQQIEARFFAEGADASRDRDQERAVADQWQSMLEELPGATLVETTCMTSGACRATFEHDSSAGKEALHQSVTTLFPWAYHGFVHQKAEGVTVVFATSHRDASRL